MGNALVLDRVKVFLDLMYLTGFLGLISIEKSHGGCASSTGPNKAIPWYAFAWPKPRRPRACATIDFKGCIAVLIITKAAR